MIRLLLPLLFVAALLAALAAGQTSAPGMYVDDSGNLRVTSEPNRTVIVNGQNMSALLEQLEALERRAAAALTTTTTTTTSTTTTTTTTTTTSTTTTTTTTTTTSTTSTTRPTPSGALQWVKLIASDGSDYGESVAVDSTSSSTTTAVYVSGRTAGNIANVSNFANPGGSDAFVARINVSNSGGGGNGGLGSVAWVRALITTEVDDATAVTTDSSGFVYWTGYTAGTVSGGNHTNTNFGESDLLVVKMFGNGSTAWVRQFGTAQYDRGQGIATDSAGRLYVCGVTNGNLFGLTNSYVQDAFLAQLSSSTGDVLWARLLNGSSTAFARGVAVDAQNNVYMTGTSSGSLDGNAAVGSSSAFVVKYNGSGSRVWSRLFGIDVQTDGLAVAVGPADNSVYVAGVTTAITGVSNGFVAKYNGSGGETLWNRTQSTTQNDFSQGVAADSDSSVYVTGYTGGSLDGEASSGGDDTFIVKYDRTGQRLWTRQMGTGAGHVTDAFGAAFDTRTNSLYITGLTDSGLNGTVALGQDAFVAKYN